MFEGLSSKEVTSFKGVDQVGKAGSRKGSILARNCSFLDGGEPYTRAGLTGVITQSTPLGVSTFVFWIRPGWSRVLYFVPGNPSKFVQYDTILDTESDLLTGQPASAVGASYAQVGTRMYFTAFDSAVTGVIPGYVWNGAFNGVPLPIIDQLFQNEMVESTDFTFTIVDSATAGQVTAGDHRVGVIFTTRNGFEQPPVVASATFTAVGGKKVQLTLTPVTTWPDWALDFFVIFTTVDNQQQFFFVDEESGGKASVAAGTSTAVTINFDVADQALVLGTEATEWFNILTYSDINGNPHIIIPFGNRIVYIVDIFDSAALGKVSTMLISEVSRPQWVTFDQHSLTLPGGLSIRAALVMNNLLYVFGPAWTFAYSDNLQFPASWAQPIQVDGQIGVNAPACVTKSPTGEYAWVASQIGLYPFNGGYTKFPVTQRITDWGRINWSTGSHLVSVADDPNTDTVMVLAPLDGATSPTHVLMFNYKAGMNWWEIKYSIWDFANMPNPGYVANLFNTDGQRLETWLSDFTATNGKFFRFKDEAHSDANIYGNDDGQPVNCQWQSENLPAVLPAPVKHVGQILGIYGSGTVDLTYESQDQTRSHTNAKNDITLSATPGRHYSRFVNVDSESCSVKITNKNTLNSWFSLEKLIHYYNKLVSQR